MEITEKEIEFDNLCNELDGVLTDDQFEIIQNYIHELKCTIDDQQNEIDNLEYENDRLESENTDLQDEIDEEKEYQNEKFFDVLKEITEERYKYSSGFKYDTKEKILERLEFLIKYGE